MFNKLFNRYSLDLTAEEAKKLVDVVDANPELMHKFSETQYENGMFAAGIVTIASLEIVHYVFPFVKKLLKK